MTEVGSAPVPQPAVPRTSSAKDVSGLGRHVEVDGDVLTYRLEMAAVGRPRQVHLEATLRWV